MTFTFVSVPKTYCNTSCTKDVLSWGHLECDVDFSIRTINIILKNTILCINNYYFTIKSSSLSSDLSSVESGVTVASSFCCSFKRKRAEKGSATREAAANNGRTTGSRKRSFFSGLFRTSNRGD